MNPMENSTGLYRKLGAHLVVRDGAPGVIFAVWAPNARHVSVIGDFNDWMPEANRLSPQAGIFEGFVPHASPGQRYKFHVESNVNGYIVDKADPFAFCSEIPPRNASVISDLAYEWTDREWMARRENANSLDAPISIYLSDRELSLELLEYVKETGFTHVELASTGSGYFAAPQDLQRLIDEFHRNGIGVFLNWSPAHFAVDEHGLAFFDGTHLYEQQVGDGYQFRYGRSQVRSFLLSSAMFWLDVYHADGIRLDSVSSMLYRGDRENMEAIDFLRELNTAVYREYPDVHTFAEESTAWPMVSRPVYMGGLGFGSKWDTGWMQATLDYVSQDPLFRQYLHDKLTFRMTYAYAENFVLPLWHVIDSIHGSREDKFATMRALLAYQYTLPGKKLLFTGAAFEAPLLVGALNHLYRTQPALHQRDLYADGFAWIDCSDAGQNIISYLRKGRSTDNDLFVICHFSPVLRANYRVGIPRGGFWREMLNTDAKLFGGGDSGNFGGVTGVPIPLHGQPYSLTLTLPPLSVLIFKNE